MKRYNTFSGDKPRTLDLNYEFDGLELAIKQRLTWITEHAGSGILKGLLTSCAITIPADQVAVVTLNPGRAAILGELLTTGTDTVALADTTGNANIIYLEHVQADSTDPDALRHHYKTGFPHVVWQEDSYLIGCTRESEYSDTADKLKLYRATVQALIGGGSRIVTADLRTWLRISDYVMSTQLDGRDIMTMPDTPPVPAAPSVSSGFEDGVIRPAGQTVLGGLVAARPAMITALVGDAGNASASGNVLTKITSGLTTWTTNQWAGQVFVDSTGSRFTVVSNDSSTITLGATDAPASGAFTVGAGADGYRFVLEVLNDDDAPVFPAQVETEYIGPLGVPQHTWRDLLPGVRYSVRVQALSQWGSASALSSPVEITAGDAQSMPAACADTIENVAVTALDAGMRITWDVTAGYVSEVAGVEICYTDDNTAPSFTNLGHRKVYVDRNQAILPVRPSTAEFPFYFKALVRCVDKAGRVNTTPLSLGPIRTILYAATPSDTAQLAVASWDQIQALLAETTPWGNVKVVAKSGGAFLTIQSAIDAITTENTVILVMPGTYNENLLFAGHAGVARRIKLVGFRAKVYGKIESDLDNDLVLVKGLKLELNPSAGPVALKFVSATNPDSVVVQDCTILAPSNSAIAADGPIPLRVVNSFLDGDVVFYGAPAASVSLFNRSKLNGQIQVLAGTAGGLDISDCTFTTHSAAVTVANSTTITIAYNKNRHYAPPDQTHGTWYNGAVSLTTNVTVDVPVGGWWEGDTL